MLFREPFLRRKGLLSSSVSLNVEKLSERYIREALEGRGCRGIYGTTSCLQQFSKFGKIQPGKPKSEQEAGGVSTGPWKKAR